MYRKQGGFFVVIDFHWQSKLLLSTVLLVHPSGQLETFFTLVARPMLIKAVRQERNLTQEELGQLVGVQKAQISKLESSANRATIGTILKVFKALNAEINFNVKLEDNFVKLA
ncbi:MAG: helix-turn-helix domain-containing protein [Runella sp.]